MHAHCTRTLCTVHVHCKLCTHTVDCKLCTHTVHVYGSGLSYLCVRQLWPVIAVCALAFACRTCVCASVGDENEKEGLYVYICVRVCVCVQGSDGRCLLGCLQFHMQGGKNTRKKLFENCKLGGQSVAALTKGFLQHMRIYTLACAHTHTHIHTHTHTHTHVRTHTHTQMHTHSHTHTHMHAHTHTHTRMHMCADTWLTSARACISSSWEAWWPVSFYPWCVMQLASMGVWVWM